MRLKCFSAIRIALGIQLLLIVPERLYGAEDQSAAELAAMPLADPGYVIQIFFSLTLVVAVIFVLSYLLRKFDITAPRTEGPVRVLHSIAIGGKEQLLLVEVGEEQILVGRSPGQLSRLHKLEQPIAGLDGLGQLPGSGNVFSRVFHRSVS